MFPSQWTAYMKLTLVSRDSRKGEFGEHTAGPNTMAIHKYNLTINKGLQCVYMNAMKPVSYETTPTLHANPLGLGQYGPYRRWLKIIMLTSPSTGACATKSPSCPDSASRSTRRLVWSTNSTSRPTQTRRSLSSVMSSCLSMLRSPSDHRLFHSGK